MTYCKSDELAQSCRETIEASSCGETTPCGQDVLDTQQAVDVCKQFLDHACEWVMRCDPTLTHDQCLAEFQGTIDCSRAVGISLTQKECFDAVEVASCDAPALPPSCSGMIQVTQ